MSISISAFAKTMGSVRRIDWRQNIIYVGFVAAFVLFAVTLGDSGFTNPSNLLNIVRQTASISVMAVSMTFVIVAVFFVVNP